MPSPLPVPVALPHGRAYAVHLRPLADAPTVLRQAGLAPGRGLVVTDETVAALYLDELRAALETDGWTVHAQAIPPGEASKSSAHLGTLYDWALGLEIDRATPLLALGGGVVGDLAGFAAATLLRGLPLVQLPTTLIAQADSAIGGKTGINHPAGKNLIGAIWQPRLVLADTGTLRTLSERDWTSGLAEVVKSALIADAAFVDWLGTRWETILDREPSVVAALVRRTAAIKAGIVAEDERETGRRALLNFGHTFGHAVEQAAGYGAFTHGEAVALGMRAALHLSQRLAPNVSFGRAEALLARLPAPPLRLPTETLTAAMATDKKRRAGRLRFVVLDAVGRASVTDDVTPEAVAAAWEAARAG